MKSLQFTPDDLAENRAGRLSAAQRAQLRSRVLALLPLRLSMASLPLIFVIMSLLTIASSDEAIYTNDRAALVILSLILVVAAGMGLALLFFILRAWLRARRSVEQGIVHSLSGYVSVEFDGRRHVLILENEDVQEQTFPLPNAASAAFQECERYRIYYLRPALRIVAAECLDH